MTPRWHATARRLRQPPHSLSYRAIAKRLGKSLTSVVKVFSPDYAASQATDKRARERARYAADPEYAAARARASKASRVRKKVEELMS